MRQAFIGYIDRIAWSSKRTKAWEFARAVGGEAALLAKWGGRRLHEEVPEEDQVSSSMDESSLEGAQEEDNSVKGNTGAHAQIARKRKRVTIEKTATTGTSLAATTLAVTPVAVK